MITSYTFLFHLHLDICLNYSCVYGHTNNNYILGPCRSNCQIHSLASEDDPRADLISEIFSAHFLDVIVIDSFRLEIDIASTELVFVREYFPAIFCCLEKRGCSVAGCRGRKS